MYYNTVCCCLNNLSVTISLICLQLSCHQNINFMSPRSKFNLNRASISMLSFLFCFSTWKVYWISEKAWKRKKRIERRKKALKPLSTEPPPPTMNPYRLEIQNFIKVFKIKVTNTISCLSTFNKQTKRDIIQFFLSKFLSSEVRVGFVSPVEIVLA